MAGGRLRPAYLPQEGNQVLGPGRAVLDADGTEELDKGLHRVAGVDVIGPLVWEQHDEKGGGEGTDEEEKVEGTKRG